MPAPITPSFLRRGLFAAVGLMVCATGARAADITVTSTGAATITWEDNNGIAGLGASQTISGNNVSGGSKNWNTNDNITFAGVGAAVTLQGAGIPAPTVIDMGTGTLAFTGDGFVLSGIELSVRKVDVATALTATINSVISGTNFEKLGDGALMLGGANTYTGVVTLTAGTLSVATIGNGGTAGNLGQSSALATNLVFNGGTLKYTGATASTNRNFTINAGKTATIEISGSANLTISGASTNTTGGLTKTGTGTLTLSGANLHTGITTVSAGTLAYGVDNALSTGDVTVSGGTLDIKTFNDSVGTVKLTGGVITGTTGTLTGTSYDMQSGTVSAKLGGAGGLAKSTAGTVTLSGNNTYTGLTTVSAGTLAFGVDNALSTGAVTVSGGTLDIKTFSDTVGAVTLTSGAITGTTGVLTGASYTTNSGTISAILAGSGVTLLQNAAGTTTLTAANTYTGGTTVTAGTLALSGAGRLADTGAVTVNGGTFDIGVVNDTVGAVTLTSGVITGTTGVLTGASYDLSSGTVSAILGGAGVLNKTGGGTVLLTGANTFSGGTTVSGGKLQVGDGGKLGSGGVLNNAVIELVNSFAASLTNSISGGGAVTLSGSGTTTFTGANTYSGATLVNAGTLFENGSSPNSAHTVASGATLGGAGAIGALTLNSGAFLSPGATGAGSIGNFGAASLVWNGGGKLMFDLGAPGTGDRLSLTGALTKGSGGSYTFDFLGTGTPGAGYTLITASSISGYTASDFTVVNLASGLAGNITVVGNDIVLTIVPEAEFAWGAAALAALVGLKRRRRSAR